MEPTCRRLLASGCAQLALGSALLVGCAETAAPTPLAAPAPKAASRAASSAAQPPLQRVPSQLAWWGGSTDGLCWLEAERVRCRTVDATCRLGNELPTPIGGRTTVELTSGRLESCGRLTAGELVCWWPGWAPEAEAPGPVPLAARAIGVSCGFDHSCAALESGQGQCWGDNSTGQLGVPAIPVGVGSPTREADPARRIALDGRIVQLAAGGGHSCALLADGQIRCWGDVRGGKLGHRLALEAALATAVPLASRARLVEAGTWTTCAVLDDGRVQCWGVNEYGLLCDDQGERTSPTTIALPAAALSVSLSETRACALLADGRVACWGGQCQARSCDLEPAPPPAGSCAPEILGMPTAAPARAVLTGYRRVCVLPAHGEPTCTCQRADP